MKLADPILIELRGEVTELRPTLFHAFALFRQHHPRDLSTAIQEGSLTAALACIEPHTSQPMLKHLVFEHLNALRFPILRYVAACMGVDANAKPSLAPATPPPPVEGTLTELYRIGTGWMGWTPGDTLDSTPAEIIEAHRGRMDMLKAIFGSGEKAAPENPMSLDEKFAAVMGGFETVKVTA